MMIYFLSGVLGIYLVILVILYFTQEKLLFFPEKLDTNFVYHYPGNFEEKWYQMPDHNKLNALHFKADSSKACILYFHGNAGALNSWGDIAGFYTSLGYDIIIPDYRGFGKSEGKITSEKQFFTDAQTIYNELKTQIPEDKIILIGYSIGSAPATYLASKNNPSKLFLLSPFYNMPDLVNKIYRIVPTFLLKFRFMNNLHIRKVKAPIAIFHGTGDELIYHGSSEKLIKLCKPDDELYLLPFQQHGAMNENPEFRSEIAKLLAD